MPDQKAELSGRGAQAAAGRRQLATGLEEGRRRDRQAHHLAHVCSQVLSRADQIFVPTPATQN